MRPERYITVYVGAILLSISVVFPCPSLAQRGRFYQVQQRHAAPSVPQQHVQVPRVQGPRAQAPRPPAPRPMQQGHAGDWLRRYKDMPPAEQERALQNDNEFRRLPPDRQQVLRDRLQRFSSLPPQQQL